MDKAQLEGLEKKITTLESEIFSLRSEFERLKRAPAVPATAAALKSEPPKVSKPIPPGPAKVQVTPPVAKTEPPVAQREPQGDAGFSWEWLIGGNIIGKIGIITLIVSTALFMVYALDQGWLSEWVRLIMLQAAFGALSYLSYRLYTRNYKFIPEILAITALAANTIAIYSAHFVYRYLGRLETIAMMFSLMALALLFARRIRSGALTMILFAGFFALPVIHSRGINEPKAYFTYLLAVNVLYFLIQHLNRGDNAFRTSPHTLWVLLVGNAVSLFGWSGTYHQYATTPLLFVALTLAMLLYTAHQMAWSEKIRVFFKPAAIITVNFFYIFMLASVLALNKDFPREVEALALLCQAAINYIILQVLPAENRNTSSASLISVLLMAIGVGVIMDGPAEKLVLAALLTAAMYLAARFGDALLYYGAAVVNAINLIALFAGLSHSSDKIFLLNFQAAGFIFYAVATIYLRVKALWPERFNFAPVLTGVALVTSFVCIITELQRIVIAKDSRLLMITLVFAAYALVLLTIGFRRQKVWFRQAGLFFMGLAIAKFYFVDIWQWDKSVRIVAGIIMGGGLVLISFYYEKFRSKFKEMGAVLLMAGLVLPSGSADALEKFKPNRFKFVKELTVKTETLEGKTYGSIVVDAELYKSAGENDLRLAFDGKIVPFTRQVRKNAEDKKVEKEIPISDLVTSVDGENTSVYIFENSNRIRLTGLKINFKEKDYTREAMVYHRPGKFQANTLAKSATLTRKAGKPEVHTIDFAAVAGEIQLQVKNEDDAALTLSQFVAISDKELIVFRIPEKLAESDKKIQIYYGGQYTQKPKYDIGDTADEKSNYAEFSVGPEQANPLHKLSLFDPPYSIWFFRTVFWLLLGLIAWRMFLVYKKEKAATA